MTVQPTTPQLQSAASHFEIPGRFAQARPYGSGHIHDTYLVEFDRMGGPTRAIVQRINTTIFRDPIPLMDNIQRVTGHLKGHLARQFAGQIGKDDASLRRALRLIPTLAGGLYHVDEEGNHWRAYHFIEGAHSYDSVETLSQAYQAARAFGEFQQRLADLPAPRLHDVLPDFHNTPKRLLVFQKALQTDSANRAHFAKPEIEFALAHHSVGSLVLDAGLPERVTHNDTKISNVLLDSQSGEALCVIDLDTVMPGFAPYDFADLVRTTTSPAAEDETDLSLVTMRFPIFAALAEGYLSTAGSFLTRAEKEHLVPASKVIAYEQGLRFLTDYLNGDTYYKTQRPDHNLDRCRTQFALLRSIEAQEKEMSGFIQSLS
jgi:hypothetical protein